MYCFDSTKIFLLKSFVWSWQWSDSCHIHSFSEFTIVPFLWLWYCWPANPPWSCLLWVFFFSSFLSFHLPTHPVAMSWIPCRVLHCSGYLAWPFPTSPRLFFSSCSKKEPLVPGSALNSSRFHMHFLGGLIHPLDATWHERRLTNPQIHIPVLDRSPPLQFSVSKERLRHCRTSPLSGPAI